VVTEFISLTWTY